MSLYSIENEYVKISVSTHGAELYSLFDKAAGKERLWQGDSAYWGRRSPVLFPVVGKYKGLKTSYMGKEYSLGQHGFARDTEFSLVSQSENHLAFELLSSEETLLKYPFKFRLVCSFTLSGKELTAGWLVENKDGGDIYFSIGAHPAFYCEKGKTVLTMKNGKDLQYSLLNEEGLYLPQKYPLSASFALDDSIFDRDALIVENSGVNEISLSDGESEYITVKFDAPLFGIWSPAGKNAPFVCIEPWYGRCDAADFEGDITSRQWGNRLKEGEIFKKEYKIIL